MSTSGLLLIAKSKEVHEALQKQFLNKTIRKTYIALLNGVLEEPVGEVKLPIASDYLNRPSQMVCYKTGKASKTTFKKLKVIADQTLVELKPVTGRTHQLRVHCAHISGLGLAIVGDDLYGVADKRLCLHAKKIEFDHPITQKRMKIDSKAPF